MPNTQRIDFYFYSRNSYRQQNHQSWSFGGCTSENGNKFEISSLQELSLIGFKREMNICLGFLKNKDLNTEVTIVTLTYSLFRREK